MLAAVALHSQSQNCERSWSQAVPKPGSASTVIGMGFFAHKMAGLAWKGAGFQQLRSMIDPFREFVTAEPRVPALWEFGATACRQDTRLAALYLLQGPGQCIAQVLNGRTVHAAFGWRPVVGAGCTGGCGVMKHSVMLLKSLQSK